ncbi:MAG TPA: hypothetical protein VMH26_13720 [Burkholderiales bacterium]|nr:hypothetical protein [Burkholderiales bacterium]
MGSIGALFLLASAAFIVWSLWWARAPGLDRLEKVSGRVKSAAVSEGQGASRTFALVVTRDDTDYELGLSQVERLPARDWPLESVVVGDRVVAWYIPERGARTRGRLWQLKRGLLRVVTLEDTAALYKECVRHALPWAGLGLLSGAVMIAVGRVRRKRATPPDQTSTPAGR